MSSQPVPPVAPSTKRSIQHRKRFWRFGAVVLVAVALGATSMWVYLKQPTLVQPNQSTGRTTPKDDGNLVTTDEESVVANVAEKVSPAVVSITTNTTVSSFFGTSSQEAAGSGIIVTADGYILTNKHVISGADSIQVVTSDGTTYSDVQVVGTDPLNDVAYLKIKDAKNLTAAILGDSSTTRVGQGVIAIGNSLGQYQNTVTSGIISGKGRPVSASSDGSQANAESLTDLIQTDAAINPGNSGGPLLNRSGQVIGINTAVAANAQGIGFAIPINATKGALKSVEAGKGFERAYLGLNYLPITADVAKRYKLSVKQGAYVIASDGENPIQTSSPAEKAGIREKDIITKINGLQVGPQGGVSSLIGEYMPGDTVDVTIIRDGKEVGARVTLAAYPQRSN